MAVSKASKRVSTDRSDAWSTRSAITLAVTGLRPGALDRKRVHQKGLGQTSVSELANGLTGSEREEALRSPARVAQDFPLLPTSESDPLPILPEEAGDSLSPQQRTAVAAFVCGQSFSMAANAANVSRRTIYNWRQQPEFKRTLDTLTRDALVTTATRVRNLMLRATRVLVEGMVGRDAFGNAMRVANSGRLWAALEKAEAKLEEEEIEAGPESDSESEPQADPDKAAANDAEDDAETDVTPSAPIHHQAHASESGSNPSFAGRFESVVGVDDPPAINPDHAAASGSVPL